ncbi:putative transposase [uncultured Desulfobacter sp.]|uniref:putative transposase n=1 Tax=uncultured Desulfobacter sp. TaxID=240139 RepID=UPI002AA836B6|nr:hypothetical protein [uncultured Desulfobacter sp.]
MPQLMLPLLSSEITYINGRVTVHQKDGQWTYFLGEYPIYSHKADDLALFRHFRKKGTGYYTAFHVLLLLALMALCRIKTVERIRGESAGEFGKLMGLDRIPEVRCLRMISTEYQLDHTRLGARMFSRWCQEIFFRYMMEHFAIDLLQEYGTQDLLPKR